MRLVEGTDLRALIAAEGPLEPLRAARIVRQVGAALDAAHARGLVHRDVKPANVLLARADHVYLSDFGLAKRAEEAGGLTRQGSIVARAEYVAPEQILEDRVDALTDVYALGCLLFEALTGEAPFAESRDGPAMLAHVNEPPPSPLARRPDLPTRVRRRRAAGDGQGAGASATPRRATSGRRRSSPPAGSARASAESVVATGPAAPLRPCPACRARRRPRRTAADVGRRRRPTARAARCAGAFALGVLAVLARRACSPR